MIVIGLLAISNLSFTQSDTTRFDRKSLVIHALSGEISLDGEITEEAWHDVPKADDFMVAFPIDGVKASVDTEVLIGYTHDGLYIAATMYDSDQVVGTLKRDQFGQGDGFIAVIDPVNKKTNGYAFGVSAGGAQTELILSNDNGDDSWDNKWFSGSKQYADRWTVEMFIPFKTLRYDPANLIWGINFVRLETGMNETHVWSPVPRQFDPGDLGYLGEITWDNLPDQQSANIALIPYLTADANGKFREDGPPSGIDVGADAKIGITRSLNLDLTVNPDFSQVDVDALVTNLTRFNIFFPERRQFFLENADLFSDYGLFANQPFYSRRIGLDPFGNTVPITYGARLTGNLTPKLRIGAFNMHQKGSDQSPGQNFSSVTTQYSIGKRSTIKGLFLNRQAYDGSKAIAGDFGRNIGGEINLSTPDGKWSGQGGYIHSLKEGFSDNNRHVYGRFDYAGERFRTFLFVQDLGENYFADMGFNARINNFDPTTGEIVRIGYTQIGNMLNYYIYPKDSEKVNYHWSGVENFVIVNHGGLLNDWYTRFRHFIFFQNTSQLRFRINHQYQNLVFPFALTENPLPAGEYDIWEFNVQFNTDTRKDVGLSMFSVYGEFYNGTKLTNIADVYLRRQPWGNFSIGVEHNAIRLPDEYGDLDITLLTARAELNFSTTMFWTTFLQFNTQSQRMNVNTRLQWRYAPMSDLFLVYTDNYTTIDRLTPTGRTFVLKASYWLGI